MKKSTNFQINKINLSKISKDLDSTKQETSCSSFAIKLKETPFDDSQLVTKDIQPS